MCHGLKARGLALLADGTTHRRTPLLSISVAFKDKNGDNVTRLIKLVELESAKKGSQEQFDAIKVSGVGWP